MTKQVTIMIDNKVVFTAKLPVKRLKNGNRIIWTPELVADVKAKRVKPWFKRRRESK